MTAPRQPIELREFPRPDLPAGAVLLRNVAVRGLRHRRAPLARPPRRACRIRSFPATSRPASSTRRAARSPASTVRRSAKGIASCSSTSIARAAAAARARCTARRRAARRGASTASPTRRTKGCSAAGPQSIYLEPGVGIARLPDAIDARRLHRRRLRPAHGGAHRRARRDPARRHGRRAGRRRGRPERHRAGPHRAAPRASSPSARPRTGSRWRARWAPTSSLDLDAHDARGDGCQAVLDATHGEGADVVIEAAGAAAAIAEGLDLARVGGRYVDRRALHRRRRQHDQRAPADQPQAPRDPRLLGQRGAAFPPRAVDSRAASVDPVPQDRRAPLRAASAERGARRRRGHADSEGAGRSVAVTRHTKIVATLGPASTAPGVLDALVAARRRRLPVQLLARHARIARARPSAPSATRPRAPAATSPSSRISAARRSAPDASPAASRSSSTRETSCASRAGDDEGGPGRVFTPLRRADRVGRSPAIGCCSTTARSSCACASAPAASSSPRSSTAASSASTRASTRRA